MPELLAEGRHGFDTQVVYAVECLTETDRAKFDLLYPEWPRVLELIAAASPLSNYYPGDDPDDPDPEIMSWVADWIEENTDMYWEDGDLWRGREDDTDD